MFSTARAVTARGRCRFAVQLRVRHVLREIMGDSAFE